MSSCKSRRLKQKRRYQRTQVTITSGSNVRFQNKGGPHDFMVYRTRSAAATLPHSRTNVAFHPGQNDAAWLRVEILYSSVYVKPEIHLHWLARLSALRLMWLTVTDETGQRDTYMKGIFSATLGDLPYRWGVFGAVYYVLIGLIVGLIAQNSVGVLVGLCCALVAIALLRRERYGRCCTSPPTSSCRSRLL